MPCSDTAADCAGREAPGKAFRLFTEASFNQLAATTLPEIQRVNLATVALQLKALGFDDLLAFDFMDRPPTAALLRALETLYALGALDDSGMVPICSLGSPPSPPPTRSKPLLLPPVPCCIPCFFTVSFCPSCVAEPHPALLCEAGSALQSVCTYRLPPVCCLYCDSEVVSSPEHAPYPP